MVTDCASVGWSFQTDRNLTLRAAPALGDATTVVVVAVVMTAFARPGVIVAPLRSK
jgi:hypothetical protein